MGQRAELLGVLGLGLSAMCFGQASGQVAEHVLAEYLIQGSSGEFYRPEYMFVSSNGFANTIAPVDPTNSDHPGIWIATPTVNQAFFKSDALSGGFGRRYIPMNSSGKMFNGYAFQQYDQNTISELFSNGGCQTDQDRCVVGGSFGTPGVLIYSLGDNGESIEIVNGVAFSLAPGQEVLLHRLQNGTYRVVAQDSADFAFVGSLNSPRINGNGTIVAVTTNSVKRFVWTGLAYSATDFVVPGEAGLTAIWPNNVLLLEDDSVVFLGEWDNDVTDLVPAKDALFFKRAGQPMLRVDLPVEGCFLGAQSEPYAAPGQQHKVRWCLSGVQSSSLSGSGDVSKIWYGVDLVNDLSGPLSWASLELTQYRGTALSICAGDVLCPAPTIGFDGASFSWNGVDSLGRLHLIRAIDDRESFSIGAGVDRRYQFVRFDPERTCLADFNSDLLVDDADFQILVTEYGKLLVPPAHPIADITFDGVVNDDDFALFVIAYNLLVCP